MRVEFPRNVTISKKCVLIKDKISIKSNFFSYRGVTIRTTLMLTRASCGKMFITKLGLGNPNTCVYQFVIGESNEHPIVITQLLILDELGTCVNFQADVAHIFYGWNFSHFSDVPVMFQKCKHFLSVDDDITIFAWGAS